MDRRNFIKTSSMASLTALLMPGTLYSGVVGKSKINVGLIATGMRGQVHLDELLKRDDV